MKISEINSEATLSIMAFIEGKQVEVPIKMTELSDSEIEELNAKESSSYIPLDVIVQEYEKKIAVISFQHSKASISLVVFQNNELYKWDGVNVKRVTLNSGKSIHLVIVPRDKGEKYNRRKGVRIDVSRWMDVEQGKEKFSVLVKDISYCGVGILESKESKINDKSAFLLYLTEVKNGENKVVAKLTCKVVRQDNLGNGYVKSGCILAKENYNFMQRYVAIKQMEELKGKSEMYTDVTRIENSSDWKKSIATQLEKYNKPDE